MRKKWAIRQKHLILYSYIGLLDKDNEESLAPHHYQVGVDYSIARGK